MKTKQYIGLFVNFAPFPPEGKIILDPEGVTVGHFRMVELVSVGHRASLERAVRKAERRLRSRWGARPV